MAVSLALNWNLPATSPILDDATATDRFNLSGTGGESTSRRDGHPPRQRREPDPSANTSPTYGRGSLGAMTYASSSSAAASAHPSDRGTYRQHSSQSIGSGNASHRGINGHASQPKSYASVASGASMAPTYPAVPMPTYGGVGLQSQAHHTAFHAPRVGSGMGWSPYGTAPFYMGAPQATATTAAASMPHNNVTEDGRRVRSQSTASRPGQQQSPQLTYNDTLQHYPGAQPSASSRPPISFSTAPQLPLPGQSSSTSNGAQGAGAGAGYHPYRRQARPSDPTGMSSTTTTASSSVGSGPPVLPMPSQVAPLGLPTFNGRARAASNASSIGTPKQETGSAEGPAEKASYSTGGSGGMRPSQSTPNLVSHAPPRLPEDLSALRPTISQKNNSTTSIERQRPEQHNPVPYTHAPSSSNYSSQHGRTDSTSSSQISSDFSHSSSAMTSTTARSVASPAARKPVPSPLAYGNRNDESTETAYAGSDDEETIGGRSTPTPGEKQRKGLSSKLRKALSLSTLQQVEAAAAAPDRAYGGRANVSTRRGDHYTPQSSGDTNGSSGSTRSTSPPRTPDNGAPIMGSSAASITSRRSTRPPLSNAEGATPKRSLFRSKFNASTDNISISSTVSSASMMLRKVGNLGKLARRSNLKGITNIFKDKEDGREGLQNDDFGTLPVASDEVAASKKDKSKSKKSSPATAAVSHATVELDHQSNGSEAMTPAASYVRQHQLQMRKQAEAERAARERAEAERAAAARAKTKTTDDVAEGRQKMIEKEKERLKSKRGWRRRLGVGSLGSSNEAQQVTGLEVVPLDESSEASSAHDVSGGYTVHSTGHDQDPAQRGQKGSFNEMSYDSAFGEDDLDPPHMPAAEGYESGGDEFETDSLRHWGEGIERSRESASRVKHVRGILKMTASTTDSSPSRTSPAGSIAGKPQNSRGRSNSYDAPQAGNTSASVPPLSHIASAATTDRVDGLPRDEEVRYDGMDSRPRSPASPPSASSHGGFGHHANSSMPTLSLIMHPSPTGHRSVTAPVARKRLVFADNHIYHSTWPAHVYDRRGELATCNRLTPLLAQRIKEELNTYKMEEMAVAPSSRIHTHFFV